MKTFDAASKAIGLSLASFALVALSGCQGFPFQMGSADRVNSAGPDMSSYFAQLIHDGKRHLRAERPGAALTAFRQASYHPDYAGEAYNGMAIAYDRMGRYDLAERFFAQAMQAAPTDERFARNATRFEQTMLARREASDARRLAQAAAGNGAAQISFALTEIAPAPTLAIAPAQAIAPAMSPAIAQALDARMGPAPAARMARVSANEVQIASREDWASRVASGETSRPAVMHVGRAQENATELAARAAPYPITIALAAIPQVQDAPAAQGQSQFANADGAVRIRVSGELRRQEPPAYPVRVRLAPAS